MLVLLAACDPDPPVSGVPAPTSVEEVRARREAKEIAASPTREGEPYVKPEGVYVDARYLCGRTLSAVRADVEEQLGPLLGTTELPEGQGKEHRFERGTLRVHDGNIYFVDLPLDPAVTRGEALVKLGFPEFAPRNYIVLAREFRLNQAWGFRRIRFERVAPDSELVDRVQVWRHDASDL